MQLPLLAANICLRCVTGFALPLAAPALYGKLELSWGTSVLGFIGSSGVSAGATAYDDVRREYSKEVKAKGNILDLETIKLSCLEKLYCSLEF